VQENNLESSKKKKKSQQYKSNINLDTYHSIQLQISPHFIKSFVVVLGFLTARSEIVHINASLEKMLFWIRKKNTKGFGKGKNQFQKH